MGDGCPRLVFDSLPVTVDDATTVLPISAFPDKRLFDESAEFPVISVAVRDTATAKKRLNEWIPCKRKVIFVDDDDNDATNRRKIVLMPNVSMTDVATRLAEVVVVPVSTARMYRKKNKKQKSSKQTENQQQQQDATSTTAAAATSVVIGPIDFTIPTTQPTMRLTRTYDDLTTEQVLRKLLPSSIAEIPSALEQVGHIAHLNLRDELLPYQHWIGQVLLDKHSSCLKTVVNKTSNIATIYRTFPMQVIAGNDAPGWSITTVQEHNCIFRLDYTTVYWNSRLSSEHDRLVREIAGLRNYRVVADCMAGVGPFAIPLAKHNRGIAVHANDLNAESIKYLNINMTLNKIKKSNDDDETSLGRLHVYNQDAREFIKDVILPNRSIECAILNLPASAPEFLDAFCDVQSIHLYVYSFAPKNDSAQAVARCQAALGNHRQLHDLSIHTVRDVSPGKNMYCISFRLSNKKIKTSLNE